MYIYGFVDAELAPIYRGTCPRLRGDAVVAGLGEVSIWLICKEINLQGS